MAFKSRMDEVLAALDDALVEAMNATAIASGSLIRTTLSRPGGGRVYRIGVGRKGGRNLRARGFHQASAPGQPPAVNTNRLRASWSVGQVNGLGSVTSEAGNTTSIYRDGSRIVLTIGSSVYYAPFLEYGTRRMRARPYLKPTLPSIASAAPRIFTTAVQRRFGGGE